MKTQSNIKKTAALIASAMLLNVSAHAQAPNPQQPNASRPPSSRPQDPTMSSRIAITTFNVGIPFSTPNYNTSDWGLSANFAAFDRFTPLPTGPGNYGYSVTANGTLRGRAMRIPFTAVEANGIVLAKQDGKATFNGSLKVFNYSVWSVVDKDIKDFNTAAVPGSKPNSGEFIVEGELSASIPFLIGPVPFDVKALIKPSVSARFVANVTTSRATAGTQINMVVGPEASAAATAEVSVGAGIEGLGALRAGVSGTLRIGSAGIMGNLSLIPVQRTPSRIGADLRGSVTMNTRTSSGSMSVFAEADIIFVGKHRVTQTIGSFNGTTRSTVLAGPITRPLF